jgi:uncharacterized protein YjlB
MVFIAYDIKPTKLVPNSPKPLLLYRNCFIRDGKVDATLAHDTFKKNGWDAQWVTTDGRYQRSHYHPATHEVMVVLSGPGTIRWATADLNEERNPESIPMVSLVMIMRTAASSSKSMLVLSSRPG